MGVLLLIVHVSLPPALVAVPRRAGVRPEPVRRVSLAPGPRRLRAVVDRVLSQGLCRSASSLPCSGICDSSPVLPIPNRVMLDTRAWSPQPSFDSNARSDHHQPHRPRMDTMSAFWNARGVLGAAAAAMLVFVAGAAHARATEPSAGRVVYLRGDRIYIATPDSTSLLPSQHVDLVEKRRVRAGAEVEERLDAAMIVARITSGSLDRARHLERLIVRAGSVPGPRALARLRVGLPNTRSNPLFACVAMDERRLTGYRRDAAGDGTRYLQDMGG